MKTFMSMTIMIYSLVLPCYGLASDEVVLNNDQNTVHTEQVVLSAILDSDLFSDLLNPLNRLFIEVQQFSHIFEQDLIIDPKALVSLADNSLGQFRHNPSHSDHLAELELIVKRMKIQSEENALPYYLEAYISSRRNDIPNAIQFMHLGSRKPYIDWYANIWENSPKHLIKALYTLCHTVMQYDHSTFACRECLLLGELLEHFSTNDDNTYRALLLQEFVLQVLDDGLYASRINEIDNRLIELYQKRHTMPTAEHFTPHSENCDHNKTEPTGQPEIVCSISPEHSAPDSLAIF